MRSGTATSLGHPYRKGNVMAAASGRFVGIDGAKASLDVWMLLANTHFTVPTTEAGWRWLMTRIGPGPGSPIVLEATEVDHLGLTDALAAAGMPPVIVTPRWTYHFARSQGKRAKTDRCDARLLAEYARRALTTVRPLPSATARTLTALIARRSELTKMLTMEQHRRHTADACLHPDLDGHIADLRTCRRAIDRELTVVVAGDPFWHRRVAMLRSIPGIGPTRSVPLAVRLQELGDLTRQAIAALAGVAPHARDSERYRGRRTIGGGRRDVCKALYQGSVVMRTHHPPMRAHGEHLVARGKEPTVALVAVARHSLGIMAAMVRDDLLWQDTKVGQGHFLPIPG